MGGEGKEREGKGGRREEKDLNFLGFEICKKVISPILIRTK